MKNFEFSLPVDFTPEHCGCGITNFQYVETGINEHSPDLGYSNIAFDYSVYVESYRLDRGGEEYGDDLQRIENVEVSNLSIDGKTITTKMIIKKIENELFEVYSRNF